MAVTTKHSGGREDGSTPGWNSGRATDSAHYGQKVYNDYGLDRSSGAGSAEDERGRKLAGGLDDVSHSLGGVSANQELDARGRKGSVKYPSKGA